MSFISTISADERLKSARHILEGLSIGDGFGQRFFYTHFQSYIALRRLPSAPWFLTDDSIMSLAIVQVLKEKETIDQDRLAFLFAENYIKSPGRGYGATAHEILRRIAEGEPWQRVSTSVFDGMGSYGNGAAMRVAPIGAYFSDNIDKVIEEAKKSAQITHSHIEGIAGAIAIAVATACVIQNFFLKNNTLSAEDLLEYTVQYTPESETKSKIQRALGMLQYDALHAAHLLGNGSLISAQDTVPFVLWCAAKHLGNYTEGLWQAVSVFGDMDTICAMVGGILAASIKPEAIPADYKAARESLDNWFLTPDYL